MRSRRRWLLAQGGRLAGLTGLTGLDHAPAWSAASAPGPAAACGVWPQWEAYASAFIQPDGRVIDDQHGTRYTTSEGQAYSLFFALVADDRQRFDTLLQWTDIHLAQGKLGKQLPGWRWGRRDDGSWGLVDANAASDADLWLVHTLLEAARRWRRPPLLALARDLLRQIRAHEVIHLAGFGPMLLPGPQGFVLADQTVRLNPSYLPLHQLRALAREDPQGPWEKMVASLPRFFSAVSPHGLTPDWVRYRPEKGWHGDGNGPQVGGHDAIRVYLWAGLAHRDDPLRARLLDAVSGMHRLAASAKGALPMQIDAARGQALPGTPPVPAGFAAALLPYARALGQETWLKQLMDTVRHARVGVQGPAGAVPMACTHAAMGARLLGQMPTYYDQVLALFGEGALQGRFGFDATGRLWTKAATAQGTQEKARAR